MASCSAFSTETTKYQSNVLKSLFIKQPLLEESIIILLSLFLSIRDARDEYSFEECLENVVEDLKWTCQKVKLYSFFLATLLDIFSNELGKVISSKSLNKKHFCSIYDSSST